MTNKLNDIFNIENVEPSTEDIVDIVPVNDTDVRTEMMIETDYDQTRRNLNDILIKGKDALEAALNVAIESEHPRAFEVVGGLMKQLSDINHQLIDLHAKRAKLETKPETDTNKASVVNNTMFVGSTTELTKMIENMRKGK